MFVQALYSFTLITAYLTTNLPAHFLVSRVVALTGRTLSNDVRQLRHNVVDSQRFGRPLPAPFQQRPHFRPVFVAGPLMF